MRSSVQWGRSYKFWQEAIWKLTEGVRKHKGSSETCAAPAKYMFLRALCTHRHAHIQSDGYLFCPAGFPHDSTVHSEQLCAFGAGNCTGQVCA